MEMSVERRIALPRPQEKLMDRNTSTRERKMRCRAISYIRRFMTIGAIRILGVDPGLRKTGWGVIEAAGSRLIFIGCGSIETNSATSLAERLAAIHRLLTGLVEREGPMRPPSRRHSSTGIRNRR